MKLILPGSDLGVEINIIPCEFPVDLTLLTEKIITFPQRYICMSLVPGPLFCAISFINNLHFPDD